MYTKHNFDAVDVFMWSSRRVLQLKLIAMNLKNGQWRKSTQILYRKRLHETFFRIQTFSDKVSTNTFGFES